jgi:hypothetical protein
MKNFYIVLFSCFFIGSEALALDPSVTPEDKKSSAERFFNAKQIPQPKLSYEEARNRNVQVEGLSENVSSYKGGRNVIDLMKNCFKVSAHQPSCSFDTWAKILKTAYENGLINSIVRPLNARNEESTIVHNILQNVMNLSNEKEQEALLQLAIEYGANVNYNPGLLIGTPLYKVDCWLRYAESTPFGKNNKIQNGYLKMITILLAAGAKTEFFNENYDKGEKGNLVSACESKTCKAAKAAYEAAQQQAAQQQAA